MELPVSHEKGRVIIGVPEELDARSIAEFERDIAGCLPAAGVFHVILDFSATLYIDSAGIGGVVQLFRQIKKKQGSLVVASCRDNVGKILKLINIQRYIPIFESVDAALSDGAP